MVKKKNHKTLELEAILQIVTESKLIRLATLQANKPKDKLLGQGRATLFGKPAEKIVNLCPREPACLS